MCFETLMVAYDSSVSVVLIKLKLHRTEVDWWNSLSHCHILGKQFFSINGSFFMLFSELSTFLENTFHSSKLPFLHQNILIIVKHLNTTNFEMVSVCTAHNFSKCHVLEFPFKDQLWNSFCLCFSIVLVLEFLFVLLTILAHVLSLSFPLRANSEIVFVCIAFYFSKGHVL